MKKTLIALLSLGFVYTALTFQSCDKLKSLLKNDLDFTSTEADFSISNITDTTIHATLGTATTTENLDQYIKDHTSGNLGISNIKSAKITSCVITILNPDSTNNFQNFKMSGASFNSNTNTTLASIGVINNNPNVYADTLSLPVDPNADYVSYLNGTQFTYTIAGQARKVTTKTLNCKAVLKFHIHVEG